MSNVDSDGKVSMMTRKAYYFAQRHHRMQKWEEGRREAGSPYALALGAISLAGGFKNHDLDIWISTLTAQNLHLNVIIQEQLIDIERTKRKMVRFRWKRSWMDRRMKELLEPAYKHGKHILLGMGDGKFACTGKGELSVPTTDLQRALKRMIKILKISRLVKIVSIDEYNTTKCCHECGEVMNHLITQSGYICQRYRLCAHCGHETDGKRRHRDVAPKARGLMAANASKNILYLLEKKALGLPRPYYLVCPWKAIENVAMICYANQNRRL